MADLRALIGSRELMLCVHAAERYQERVRPTLELPRATAELIMLLRSAVVTSERPAWATGTDRATEWAVVNDAIALPILAGRLITTLTRGEVGAEVRVLRAERRQRRTERQSAPGARKKHGKVRRDERRRRRELKAHGWDG